MRKLLRQTRAAIVEQRRGMLSSPRVIAGLVGIGLVAIVAFNVGPRVNGPTDYEDDPFAIDADVAVMANGSGTSETSMNGAENFATGSMTAPQLDFPLNGTGRFTDPDHIDLPPTDDTLITSSGASSELPPTLVPTSGTEGAMLTGTIEFFEEKSGNSGAHFLQSTVGSR